jgi:hypothetical protein
MGSELILSRERGESTKQHDDLSIDLCSPKPLESPRKNVFCKYEKLPLFAEFPSNPAAIDLAGRDKGEPFLSGIEHIAWQVGKGNFNPPIVQVYLRAPRTG